MDKLLSIIIPVYNAFEYTKECIDSISRNTQNYEIILVDNGSNPPYLFDGSDNTIIIHTGENLGFPKAVNIGLKQAKGDYLCILNNDVIVTYQWGAKMIDHFDKADMVGPCTNSISGIQQVMLPEIYRNIEQMEKVVKASYSLNKGKYIPFHRLVAFCLMMKREVYETIGGLDEIYGMGNYEDDDYCLTAIDAGFKLAIASDVYIHHFGSVTHSLLNVEYAKLLKHNKKIFSDKWTEEKYKQVVKKHEDLWNKTEGGYLWRKESQKR